MDGRPDHGGRSACGSILPNWKTSSTSWAVQKPITRLDPGAVVPVLLRAQLAAMKSRFTRAVPTREFRVARRV
jgi:hypothetical protein